LHSRALGVLRWDVSKTWRPVEHAISASCKPAALADNHCSSQLGKRSMCEIMLLSWRITRLMHRMKRRPTSPLPNSGRKLIYLCRRCWALLETFVSDAGYACRKLRPRCSVLVLGLILIIGVFG
jgi:DNA-directed RNA polymerase subunit RPC12/RpoP